MRLLRTTAALLFLVAALASPVRAEPLAIVAHVHTDASMGRYTAVEIAAMLDTAGLDGAIFTDHDATEIAWGLPPVRKLFPLRHRRDGILEVGLGRYVESIEHARASYPSLLLLAGLELNPFYGVSIDWTAPGIRVSQLHEHLLAVGPPLEKLMDHPSVRNGFHVSPTRRLAFGAAAGAVIVILCLAFRLLGKPRVIMRGARARARSQPVAVVLVLFTLGFVAVDVAAVRSDHANSFGVDPGAAIRERLADWIRSQGGVAFWAHPDVQETLRAGPVTVETAEYVSNIRSVDGHHGFGSFSPRLLKAGGVWDQALEDYCRGERQHPVWHLAEADFRRRGVDFLWHQVNFIHAPERTGDAVVEALREGAFYAAGFGSGARWRIETFALRTANAAATTGRSIPSGAEASIHVALRKIDAAAKGIAIEIVRDGRSHHTTGASDSVEFHVPLPPNDRPCGWVRLHLGANSRIEMTTSPIFVGAPPEGGAPWKSLR